MHFCLIRIYMCVHIYEHLYMWNSVISHTQIHTHTYMMNSDINISTIRHKRIVDFQIKNPE